MRGRMTLGINLEPTGNVAYWQIIAVDKFNLDVCYVFMQGPLS